MHDIRLSYRLWVEPMPGGVIYGHKKTPLSGGAVIARGTFKALGPIRRGGR